MRVYETTFIINPQLEEATIDKKVNLVAELISNNDGKILHTDHIGTRRLAYEIGGLTQGYYASFIFEAKPEIPKTLDHHFKLDETYLRFLTVCYEGNVLEDKQKLEEKNLAEANEAKSKVKEVVEETTTEETAEPASEETPQDKATKDDEEL